MSLFFNTFYIIQYSLISHSIQLQIRIIEYIHSKGLVYHDIKPTNIAIDNNDEGRVFFYDFAFSKFYVNAMGEPKPREDALHVNGTPEYMARGPLNGGTQCRKDDLISLGLVLLELNGVDLPWMDPTEGIEDIYEAMDIVLEQWDEHGIYVRQLNLNRIQIIYRIEALINLFVMIHLGNLQSVGKSEFFHQIF